MSSLKISRLSFLLFSFCLFYQTMSAQLLDQHLWENRILIVKSSNRSNPLFLDQLNELENHLNGMIERKLLVYQIIDDQYQLINFEKKQNHQWKTFDHQ